MSITEDLLERAGKLNITNDISDNLKSTFDILSQPMSEIPIEPSLEEVRNSVIQDMSSMCEQKIVYEFYSTCLGESLLFGCKKDEDQPWIIGLYMTASTIKQLYPDVADMPNPKLPWKNQDAIKCFNFTPNQMIQLGDDMQTHIMSIKDRFYDLRIWANDSARNIEELNSWSWGI